MIGWIKRRVNRLITENDTPTTYHQQIQSAELQSAFDASDITVGVVGMGIQHTHPGLKPAFTENKGYDFSNHSPDPRPKKPLEEYHGTHVAGIVAGRNLERPDSLHGISNAKLRSYRVIDNSDDASGSTVASGIQRAVTDQVDLILAAIAGPEDEAVYDTLDMAQEAQIPVLVPSGNHSQRALPFPATHPHTITISAVTEDGRRLNISNIGEEIDVCAPGFRIRSATNRKRGYYEELSGTSMACAIVAGIASIMMAERKMETEELRQKLRETARDIGLQRTIQGAGLVDAKRAVASVRG